MKFGDRVRVKRDDSFAPAREAVVGIVIRQIEHDFVRVAWENGVVSVPMPSGQLELVPVPQDNRVAELEAELSKTRTREYRLEDLMIVLASRLRAARRFILSGTCQHSPALLVERIEKAIKEANTELNPPKSG